jgi:hypothetical protein
MNSTLKHSYSDIGAIIYGLIILTIVTIVIIRKRRECKSYKDAILFVVIGIFLLLFSIIGNCLVAGRWDLDYIKAFLLLISLNGVFFQLVAVSGYASLFLGLIVLLIVISNRIKGKVSLAQK